MQQPISIDNVELCASQPLGRDELEDPKNGQQHNQDPKYGQQHNQDPKTDKNTSYNIHYNMDRSCFEVVDQNGSIRFQSFPFHPKSDSPIEPNLFAHLCHMISEPYNSGREGLTLDQAINKAIVLSGRQRQFGKLDYAPVLFHTEQGHVLVERVFESEPELSCFELRTSGYLNICDVRNSLLFATYARFLILLFFPQEREYYHTRKLYKSMELDGDKDLKYDIPIAAGSPYFEKHIKSLASVSRQGKKVDKVKEWCIEETNSANLQGISYDQLGLSRYLNAPGFGILIKNAKKATKAASSFNPCYKGDSLETFVGKIGKIQEQLQQQIEDFRQEHPDDYLAPALLKLKGRLDDLKQLRIHVAFMLLYNAAALFELGVRPSKDANGIRTFPPTSADLQALQRNASKHFLKSVPALNLNTFNFVVIIINPTISMIFLWQQIDLTDILFGIIRGTSQRVGRSVKVVGIVIRCAWATKLLSGPSSMWCLDVIRDKLCNGVVSTAGQITDFTSLPNPFETVVRIVATISI